MSHDPSSMEADLRRLRAAGLDESLLARLDACTEGTWARLDPAEIRYERRLLAVAPAALPPALMASLESTLREVSFPTDETIVRFPQRGTSASRPHRGWWGAAAVVALTGAISALLVPVDPGGDKLTGTSPNKPAAASPPAVSELIPAGFNRGLSAASDEGVVWQSEKQPHRVVKVIYKERVTLRDAAGRTYQMEQPRVEYILVPAKID